MNNKNNFKISDPLELEIQNVLKEYQSILDSGLISEENKQKIYEQAKLIAEENIKKKLKARYSKEIMEDLRAFHNIDVEDEMNKIMEKELE